MTPSLRSLLEECRQLIQDEWEMGESNNDNAGMQCVRKIDAALAEEAAGALRCAMLIDDAYKQWDTRTPWKDVLNAAIARSKP